MITDNVIISLNSHYGTKNNGSYLSNVYFPFKGILTDNPLIKKKYLTLLMLKFQSLFTSLMSTIIN